MSEITFLIVDRPAPVRNANGLWARIVQQVVQLPPDKALSITRPKGVCESSLRTCLSLAARKAGFRVSVRKEDGAYLVMRKTDLVA